LEKLGINYSLLVAQIFNVIFLVWMLSKFLYTPILNLLKERTQRVEDGLKEADKVREQMAAQRKENEVELAKARQEAGAVMAQATERARIQEQELINAARAEAERIKSDARANAEREALFEEKFAELIVKECANRASWAQDTGEADIGGEVLKHFGVEE
jgi:F-type H+-transporting ATPase subunit b